jgi:hypothetical protein
MPIQRAITLLAAVSFLLIPAKTFGTPYQSAQGFRFDYPDAWLIANKQQQQAVGEAAQKMAKGVDFSRVEVLIYNPQSMPIQNVNVVVASGQLPPGDEGAAQVQSALQQQFSASGVNVRNLACKYQKLGNYDSISSTWVMSVGPVVMHQQQLMIGGEIHNFVITCSAGPDNFAAAQPAFNQIINSFHIDEAPAKPKSWWSSLSPAASGAIIGGGVAMALGLVRSLSKAGKRT